MNRTNFRTWAKIIEKELTSNPFTSYAVLLGDLQATAEDALQRSLQLFEEAITNYTVEAINEIFISNLIANKAKYEEMIELFNEKFYPFDDVYRVEDYEHTRTPDLESSSTSNAEGTATSERKQSRTTTSTPGVTTTQSHNVSPYDSSGYKAESQDITSEAGNNTIVESFSGQPDTTTTNTEAQSTVTTTGTDKNEYKKIIHGRDGSRPASEVISDGLKAAEMYDIMDIIINDIADQVFLQVWI